MHWNPEIPAETSGDNGSPVARPDFERTDRSGVPEVILAERKTVEQSLDLARRFLQTTGRAILSRVSPELEARLRTEFECQAKLQWLPEPRAAILRRPGVQPTQTGGQVGVICAGTSDIPWAEEAALLCREMGCGVHIAYDVGVAGIIDNGIGAGAMAGLIANRMAAARHQK